MKNGKQATQRKKSRSFTQEMHLVFSEWVNKLPFVQKETHKAPGEDNQDNVASDKEAKGKLKRVSRRDDYR
jgi:hypothetical protein